jgi:hypothetical protein
VTFSDLELAVSQSSRKHGYIRQILPGIWTPGAGKTQRAYSRELAGAMLWEADEFFDRALSLYLLRSHLRDLQASTWAGVASYYTNYFLALSFIRLHMKSVTHLPNGPIFKVTRTDSRTPLFEIQQRSDRQRHADVWRAYYEVVNEMGWPDSGTVSDIAPALDSLRFREQRYRERINYRPGEGFEEICLPRARSLRLLKAELTDDGKALLTLSDAAFTDRMAASRLKHLATLLRRLGSSRFDVDVEASLWYRRMDMVVKYARSAADRRSVQVLLSSGA